MNTEIRILRGPDRVRKRPAVIFGSDDAQGAMTAVQMLLHILAEEAAKGQSKSIQLTQYPDGSIMLQDRGTGVFMDGPKDADDGIWTSLFCELYAGSRYDPSLSSNEELRWETTDNLELCAVQYASEYMDVCVNRESFSYQLHFEKGENISGLTKTPTAEPSGVCIRFKPDPEVFSQITLPALSLDRELRALAIHNPGLQTLFRRETAEGVQERTYCYPEGIRSYLQERNKNGVIYAAELSAEGQDRYNKPRYGANVRVGLCFEKNAGFCLCYHNRRELPHGGTHRDALMNQVTRYLEWMLEGTIDREALLAHLQLVIITDSKRTSWVNGARTAIDNILIRDLTQDTVGEDFRYYVKQNMEYLKELFCV